LKTVDLTVQSNAPPIWTCPSRPTLPIYSTSQGQWDIGYQYFGGITTWVNPVYPSGTPSFSPIKLSSSKSWWVLAADAVVNPGGGWGQPPLNNTEPELYVNMPPHKKGGLNFPAGGNEVFCDGSAQWELIDDMRLLTTWSITDRLCYFYQDNRDFPAFFKAHMDSGKMVPQ
jgi:hypothetical protein